MWRNEYRKRESNRAPTSVAIRVLITRNTPYRSRPACELCRPGATGIFIWVVTFVPPNTNFDPHREGSGALLLRAGCSTVPTDTNPQPVKLRGTSRWSTGTVSSTPAPPMSFTRITSHKLCINHLLTTLRPLLGILCRSEEKYYVNWVTDFRLGAFHLPLTPHGRPITHDKGENYLRQEDSHFPSDTTGSTR